MPDPRPLFANGMALGKISTAVMCWFNATRWHDAMDSLLERSYPFEVAIADVGVTVLGLQAQSDDIPEAHDALRRQHSRVVSKPILAAAITEQNPVFGCIGLLHCRCTPCLPTAADSLLSASWADDRVARPSTSKKCLPKNSDSDDS